MNRNIDKEYEEYKAGFINGKSEITDLINSNDTYEITIEENMANSWYGYGCEDGFNYFSKLIKNDEFNLEKISIMNIINKCFERRLLINNKNTNNVIKSTKNKAKRN